MWRADLDPSQVGSESTGQESVCTKRWDAHKAAQVDQLDALQVVQRQFIIEQLGKACDLIVVHRLACSDLQCGTDLCTYGRRFSPASTMDMDHIVGGHQVGSKWAESGQQAVQLTKRGAYRKSPVQYTEEMIQA